MCVKVSCQYPADVTLNQKGGGGVNLISPHSPANSRKQEEMLRYVNGQKFELIKVLNATDGDATRKSALSNFKVSRIYQSTASRPYQQHHHW